MVKKKTLKEILRKAGVKKRRPKDPVWKGPEIDGITQSLLGRFLVCKERFRLLVVDGLKPQDVFNHRIEYGNMWHLCEEIHAAGGTYLCCLSDYAKELCVKYPLQQEDILKWYNICLIQFPIYLNYWSKHKRRGKEKQILQEQTFNVPYELPSGRIVRLRGMCDGVKQIKIFKNTKNWLREHKTKGDIKPEQIERQLTFDLQTMLYPIALNTWNDLEDGSIFGEPISGIEYNVVRRPLSGGKGSIRQYKPTKTNLRGESKTDYHKRLGVIIEENASDFFMRWHVVITPEDIERFKTEFLDPCLEHLCEWWDHVTGLRKNNRIN